jgi:hypothetical protein
VWGGVRFDSGGSRPQLQETRMPDDEAVRARKVEEGRRRLAALREKKNKSKPAAPGSVPSSRAGDEKQPRQVDVAEGSGSQGAAIPYVPSLQPKTEQPRAKCEETPQASGRGDNEQPERNHKQKIAADIPTLRSFERSEPPGVDSSDCAAVRPGVAVLNADEVDVDVAVPHTEMIREGARDGKTENNVVARWLDARNKRLRVVLAAAMEMEYAVAAASYAQSTFDPHMSGSCSSRGGKLHALLRTSHEVVQRLEASGVSPAVTEKEEAHFPAVSDVLEQLRALNQSCRGSASEHPMSSDSAAGSEVAPLGVDGGKESPKSLNDSERHPPNQGPEKPQSVSGSLRHHTSISGVGQPEGDPERYDQGWKEGEGEGSELGGEGFISPFALDRRARRAGLELGGLDHQHHLTSLMDSAEVGGASDQMSASQLRMLAGFGVDRNERGGQQVAYGMVGASGADAWADEGLSRIGGGQSGAFGGIGSDPRQDSRLGRGVDGVKMLTPEEGALSDAANGIVRCDAMCASCLLVCRSPK